jgi:hypothetical protein
MEDLAAETVQKYLRGYRARYHLVERAHVDKEFQALTQKYGI